MALGLPQHLLNNALSLLGIHVCPMTQLIWTMFPELNLSREIEREQTLLDVNEKSNTLSALSADWLPEMHLIVQPTILRSISSCAAVSIAYTLDLYIVAYEPI